jgi:DNA-3-methyladenine glycosylase II
MAKTVVTFNGKKAARPEIVGAIPHLSKDPVLKRLIAKVGPCQLRPKREYFFVLCDSIISQQLSVAVSNIILERFRKHCAKAGKYPTPKEVLAAKDEDLRKLGLSYQKISYIKDLAAHFADGRITPRKFHALSDEKIIAELVAVKGIGRWTAEMFLIFSLCRLDVWPVDDLGIKKAVQQQYKMKALPTGKELDAWKRHESWRPYRSVASWYLWRSL